MSQRDRATAAWVSWPKLTGTGYSAPNLKWSVFNHYDVIDLHRIRWNNAK